MVKVKLNKLSRNLVKRERNLHSNLLNKKLKKKKSKSLLNNSKRSNKNNFNKRILKG